MHYNFQTEGTCARFIAFEYDGFKVTEIQFLGGCDGNLKAVAKLVDGMSVEEIEQKLLGNECGFKGTSCADQLAIAVRKAHNKFYNL